MPLASDTLPVFREERGRGAAEGSLNFASVPSRCTRCVLRQAQYGLD